MSHMRVLFVCLGNICRSPMAEAVLRARVAERALPTGSRSLRAAPEIGTSGAASPRDPADPQRERHQF